MSRYEQFEQLVVMAYALAMAVAFVLGTPFVLVWIALTFLDPSALPNWLPPFDPPPPVEVYR